MRRIARLWLITVALVALFAAGTAAASVDLRKVILKPGKCMKFAKVQVCAPKARTRTVTTTETVASPPVTVTAPAVTVTTPPPPPAVAFSDGTYRVGPDIQPGTYRSTATGDSCYWARLRGFGGTLDEIIANDIGTSPTIVTIAPTDTGFTSSRCGGWARIG